MGFNSRIEDDILIFTLTNPANGYAIDSSVLNGLEAAVNQVNINDEVSGLILTGQDRFFCSGLCLKTLVSFTSRQEMIDWFKFQDEVLYKLFTCAKPVIAAINGHCVGGGMYLALACDHRLIRNHPKIKVGLPEINLGLGIAPITGEVIRFGLDSDKRYREVMFSGNYYDPQSTVDLGVFDEVLGYDVDIIAYAKNKIVQFNGKYPKAFVYIKQTEKQHSAKIMQEEFKAYNWNTIAEHFNDKQITTNLKKVLQSMKK